MTATRYGGKRQKKHSKAKRTQRRRQKGGTVEYNRTLIKDLISTGSDGPTEDDAKKMLVDKNILTKSMLGFGNKYTFKERDIDVLRSMLKKIQICTDTKKIDIKYTKDTTNTEYKKHKDNTINKKFKLDPYLYANRFNEMVVDIKKNIGGGIFNPFKKNKSENSSYVLTSNENKTISDETVNKAYFLYLLLKDFITHSTIVNNYYIIK